MPNIRPFRALRFDPAVVGDLAAVVAPAHDLIDDAEHERLLARHPANVVRVDLPETRSGDEPDDRYRRAARAMAEWRSGAILHKDPHPSIYLYERTRPVPGSDVAGRQVGFFARVRLEPFGPGSGILSQDPMEVVPDEERYRLLRAMGVNTSPVVGLYDDVTDATSARIASLMDLPADTDLTTDDGARHRLWAVAADGEGEMAAGVAALLGPAMAAPLTIARGQDVYVTALRYRDERRMSRSCEEDPAFDYVLMLLLERTGQSLDPEVPSGLVINPHEW